MRIAVISMHTSPLEQPGTGDSGGMNVYVLSTAQHLAKQGITVDIYTRSTRGSRDEVIEVGPNLRVINIVAGPYEGLSKEELPTQLAAFSGGIIRFSRRENLHYDLIHAHYWLSGQVGWLLRDLWQIPLVFTAHTWAAVKNQFRSAEDVPESEARRIGEQQLVDNADVITVNTVEERSALRQHYDASAEKISVISPGADVELFTAGTHRATERSRRELGIPLDTRVVAYVGRLQSFKGPQVLIRAVGEIFRRNPDRNLSVILVGGSSGQSSTLETYRQLITDLGIEKRVRILEPRPPQELVSVYRAADIVAVPSFNESFGLVALEAEATGTPVVAARVGGLPIAVVEGRTGVLVDDHQPSSWADALESLLDDDETRMQMGEAAVAHAQSFSWVTTATQLATLYQQLLVTEDTADERRKA